MHRLLRSFFLITLILTIIGTASGSSLTLERGIPERKSWIPKWNSDDNIEIENALHQAISDHREEVMAFLIFDVEINRIEFAYDSDWALVWLDLIDPETGEFVPTEPGLVIASRDGDSWHIILQSDPIWADRVVDMPYELMSEENRVVWLEQYRENVIPAPSATYGVYLLPWEEGLSKTLTRSISHGGTGVYAFDFADGTIFPTYAAKGGTVHKAVWAYPNGFDDGSCANSNYIILKDETTNPTTYQLYLHLAFESIPEGLRTPGTVVVQGQYIGDADDTGCSTGHHLHFHVHTNPSSYWGTALDITFDDVSINGGRPRTPAEAAETGEQGQRRYISGNVIRTDIGSPIGGLFSPATGDVLAQSTVTLDGWVFDEDSEVAETYFLAKTDKTNAWVQVGPTFTDLSLTYEWDMCVDGVPNGSVSVGLFAEDTEGNKANLLDAQHFVKQFKCSPQPPACTPSAIQVALFTKSNYEGDCITLDVGSHLFAFTGGGFTTSAISPIAARTAGGISLSTSLSGGTIASTLVGDKVLATLYREVNFRGRGQTFEANDSNLASDWVGVDNLPLAHVQLKTTPPFSPIPAWPATGETLPEDGSLSLVWDDGGGSLKFQARVIGSSETITSTWLTKSVWHLGSLMAGDYIWQVRARNDGGVGAWSQAASFFIQDAQTRNIEADHQIFLPSAFKEFLPSKNGTSPITAPVSINFDTDFGGWTASGLWNLLGDPNVARSASNSWWYGAPVGNFASGSYDTGAPNTGDLTSPLIHIPTPGYFLRFWYRYQTEGPGINWDQRWVQISVDGSPFTSVIQLSDDPPDLWLQSPSIDLSAYAGQTIQVRFHFETLDARENAFTGWLIDDLEITTIALPTCTGIYEPNNIPGQAVLINPGDTVTAEICPGGDVDFYTFTGNAGDQIGIDIDSYNFGSMLDTYIFLLDEDGVSVLAENDDLALGELDSLLSYQLPRDGRYYLKVRAWNNPSVGGAAYFYTMTLFLDPDAPVITTFRPTNPSVTTSYLSINVPITATVNDVGSGVSHVEFLWHSGDWLNDDWILLDNDFDGGDGWGLDWDTSALADQLDTGLFIRAYDRAGNTSGVGIWALAVDRSPPNTTAEKLPDRQGSTAVLLEWNATDNLSPIRRYDIHQNVDNTGWATWLGDIDPSVTQMWFVGELGTTYGFRIRAVDEAGNIEPYAEGAEVSTTTLPCTKPDEWDDGEDDNTISTARPITTIQTHNFCVPGDEDWLQIKVTEGIPFQIETTPLHQSSAVVIELYADDGTTLLAKAAPGDNYGQSTLLTWKADESGTNYVRLYHPVSGIAGNAVAYAVKFTKGYEILLPMISR